MEVGPGHYKPNDNDDGEGKIIEDAAGLPKPDGIGEERVKGGKWRLGKGG